MTIKLLPNEVIEIDGVKLTYDAIRAFLRPRAGRLCSITRVLDHLDVETYSTPERAAEFFTNRAIARWGEASPTKQRRWCSLQDTSDVIYKGDVNYTP